jgi:hypothetical protein
MAFQNWEDEAYARQLAESSALRKNAFNTQGQMVGRVFVPKNPWQNFTEGLAGGVMGGVAERGQKTLDEGRQKQVQDWMGQMPSDTATATLPDDQAGPVGPYTKPARQQASEMRDWATKGASLPSALANAAAAKGMDYAMTAPQREAEQQERTTAREAELAARNLSAKELQAERIAASTQAQADRLEAQKQRDADARALRLTIAGMAQSGRGQNADLDRQLKQLQIDAASKKLTELTPAQQKVEAAKEAKKEGQQQFKDAVSDMEGLFTKLDKSGGIPSTKRGMLDNTMAAIGASGVGQATGRVVGTENQAVRDEINSSRLQLLNAIKSATGMSAQQMNSNVELQTWLNSLGSPGMTVEANKNILDNIKKRFGGEDSGADAGAGAKTVVREVKLKDGRTGVEYSDGTRGFK